jgi:PIN domain nuclease of toxin-antitoxin system
VVIWAVYEPERLPAHITSLLEDPANELLFSYAAVWEILNKIGRGGILTAGNSVADAYEDIQALGLTLIPVTIEHILAAASLPDIHRDPYDRMYIAQALAEGVPLVTIDPDIWKYPLETIWK